MKKTTLTPHQRWQGLLKRLPYATSQKQRAEMLANLLEAFSVLEPQNTKRYVAVHDAVLIMKKVAEEETNGG